MLFVGTSIIHPSTEGVFLLCNILDLLIYSFEYTLFCITLVDGKGALLEGEMVQTTSEMLKNAIGESLRKGDLFTCYSPVQYLVLLNGAGQEHVLAVCERVERSLKQWENGKKINFSHQILGLAP